MLVWAVLALIIVTGWRALGMARGTPNKGTAERQAMRRARLAEMRAAKNTRGPVLGGGRIAPDVRASEADKNDS